MMPLTVATDDCAPGAVASLRELIALRERIAGGGPPARIPAAAPGLHASSRLSRGMEFAEARPYLRGDDARSIDWRQTARRGRPYTKLFQEERERPLRILVDLGPSMRFGTRVAFKSVIAARAAALLAWMAHASGDRIGGVVWDGAAHREMHAHAGRHGTLDLLRCIAQASAAATTNAAPDMTASLRALARMLRPGSLAVLISDFTALDAGAAHEIALLARRAELVLAQVYDAFEADAPPGRYRITDGKRCMTLDLRTAAARDAHGAAFMERSAALQALARRCGATLLPLATHFPLAATLRSAFPDLSGSRAA